MCDGVIQGCIRAASRPYTPEECEEGVFCEVCLEDVQKRGHLTDKKWPHDRQTNSRLVSILRELASRGRAFALRSAPFTEQEQGRVGDMGVPMNLAARVIGSILKHDRKVKPLV